jgi:periplasmic protein TonB
MWLRVGCLGFLIAMAVPCHAETDAVDAWKKQIVTRLNASKRFPLEARGQSGVAKVTFVLDRSGKLISRKLTQSSGLPALDKEALATVGRVQPFPVPPPEIDDDVPDVDRTTGFRGKTADSDQRYRQRRCR